MINYRENKDIDRCKWDSCIKSSGVSVPYAYSWYLDLASPGWDALVKDNYTAVMPLTQRRKFGIRYLYQPLMCQQLGVFSSVHSEPFFVDDFVKSIPEKYRLVDIFLNKHNTIRTQTEISISQRSNYRLNLNRPYDYLYGKFNKSHRKNIDSAQSAGITLHVGAIGFDEFYTLKMNSFFVQDVTLPRYQKQDYYNLFKTLELRGFLRLYSAHYNNQLVGAACFVIIDGWSTLQSFNNDVGKRFAVGYSIVNQFVKDYAEQDLTLDFMGSNIPGIAFHNKGYGSFEETYSSIKIYRLPKIIRLLKK